MTAADKERGNRFCKNDDCPYPDCLVDGICPSQPQTSSPALQGSEEVLGNATLADPISSAQRISSEVLELPQDQRPLWQQFDDLIKPLMERAGRPNSQSLYDAMKTLAWAAHGIGSARAALRNLSAEPVASDEASKLVFPNPPSNSGSAGE